MTFAKIAKSLRATSAGYGGIPHFLEAADRLDRACSAFFKEQDLDSMRELNAAVARAEKFRKETAAEDRGFIA